MPMSIFTQLFKDGKRESENISSNIVIQDLD